MNKTELIEVVSQRLGDRRAATEAVEAVVDAITRAVAKGEKVGITGFGVFEKVERAARTARNPTTGAAVKLKKTSVPKFRPGQGFKDIVSGAKKVSNVPGARAGTARAGSSARAAAGAASSAAKAPARAARAAVGAAKGAATAVTRAPAKSATKAPAKAPAKVAAKAPGKVSVKAPTRAAAKAPAKASAKAPAKAAAKAPVTSSAAAKAPGRRATAKK